MTTATILDPTLIAALNIAAEERDGRIERNELRFRCPFPDHADEHPSARWNAAKGTFFCDTCKKGGGAIEFARLLGIELPKSTVSVNGRRPKASSGKIATPAPSTVTKYDYKKDGKVICQSVRKQFADGTKTFFQRRPRTGGGWINDMEGIEPPLYRIDEFKDEDQQPFPIVMVVEGEKDVDRIYSESDGSSLCATTNIGGAGKWHDRYSDDLVNEDVLLIPDNDRPGYQHMLKVYRSLEGKAGGLRILRLSDVPDKGDLSDWLNAGHTFDEINFDFVGTPWFTPEIPGAEIIDVDELARLAGETEDDSLLAPFSKGVNGENGEKGESTTQPSRLRLTSLSDLLAEDVEETNWLVSDMLPMAGLSIIGAKPKVGKSTTARTLAYQTSRGGEFLGRKCAQGPVVYLALEEKRSEVAKQFRQMGAQDEPIFVHVGAAPEEALAAFAAAIDEHKPILGIADPILKLIRLRDANDYAEVTRAMEPLIELARNSGCHIMCVHHLGKGDRTGGDAILGSTALFGAVDTALLMKRRNDQRIIESVQRYGTDYPETVITLDFDTGMVTAAGEVATIEMDEMCAKVLEALADEELTEPLICDRLGGNPTPIAKAIRHLHAQNQLTRLGKGRRGDPYVYRDPAVTPVSPLSPFPILRNGDNGQSRFEIDEMVEMVGGTI